MGFFNWAAPLFGRFANRWSPTDVDEIAGWLGPYVPPGGALLDVGGGTGALAQRLQGALAAEVTVIDPTPEMLSYLPAGSGVHTVLGVAEQMPFADDSFDAVIVTDAFHHFPDQKRAIREFGRVVRPRGAVVVLELDPRGWAMRTVALGERLLGEPAAFLAPESLCGLMAEHGIEGQCTLLGGVSYRFLGEVGPSGASD